MRELASIDQVLAEMPHVMKCHYEVLEVERNSDQDTLKKQYRKLALKVRYTDKYICLYIIYKQNRPDHILQDDYCTVLLCLDSISVLK